MNCPAGVSEGIDLQHNIESVAVLGAGTMGHGIAHVAALAEYSVVLCDVSEDALARGIASIERNLAKAVQLGKLDDENSASARQRISITTDVEAAAEADLVIEAAPERMELKQDLLRRVEAAAQKPLLFASNTSSLSITALSINSSAPGRVIGMHFFNPVHIMRLVEVVVGQQTAPETVATVIGVARRMRKEPITVKDVPGFASSRLGLALGLEAMRMLEQGVASARDIDTAMELGYNHPMGPLKLTDLVGLDVRLQIAEYLYESFGTDSFRPPEILARMVREGKLGKKSGSGFYEWPDQQVKTEAE